MTITINGTTGIAGVDGSAATPAVQGTDTNTGVFFGTDTVTIATGGTAAVTVDSGQRTKFPTTIGIGGATPSTSGSGVSFPATQSASTDANTLDDYEEGDWTPNQGAGITIVSGSFSSSGKYTKIGRLVTVQFTVKASAITISAGGAISTNLPFTVSGPSYQPGTGTDWAGTVTRGCLAFNGGTTIYNQEAFSSTEGCFFQCSYLV